MSSQTVDLSHSFDGSLRAQVQRPSPRQASIKVCHQLTMFAVARIIRDKGKGKVGNSSLATSTELPQGSDERSTELWDMFDLSFP